MLASFLVRVQESKPGNHTTQKTMQIGTILFTTWRPHLDLTGFPTSVECSRFLSIQHPALHFVIFIESPAVCDSVSRGYVTLTSKSTGHFVECPSTWLGLIRSHSWTKVSRMGWEVRTHASEVVPSVNRTRGFRTLTWTLLLLMLSAAFLGISPFVL